jgi:hypothetical protein
MGQKLLHQCFIASFRWIGFKRGNFELEAKGAYSDSTSWYDPLGRRNSIRDTNSPTASGVTYRAERSSLLSTDWKFTQVAGPDIATVDLTKYIGRCRVVDVQGEGAPSLIPARAITAAMLATSCGVRIEVSATRSDGLVTADAGPATTDATP